MTLRVCLFGNSHLAALRQAWTDGRERWPGLDLTMIGAHKGLLLQTEITGGVLRPATDAARDAFARFGGLAEVDLRSFDAIGIVGCQVAAARAAFLHKEARWVGLPSVAACPNLATMEPRLISRRAYVAMLKATLSETLGGQFATHLRAGTDRPICLLSQPRTHESILSGKRVEMRALLNSIEIGDGAALSDLFDTTARGLFEAIGVDYLPQPAETVSHHLLTARAYTEGAERLAAAGNAPQPKTDILHANAAYGALALDGLAARLAA